MHYSNLALAAAMQEVESGATGYLSSSPLELLRERVISAIENVPFYRELYGPFGAVPPLDGFLEWFQRLPIVNKSQLQAVGEARLLNPRYSTAELIRRPTSGSTGVPFTLLLDSRIFVFRKWRFQKPHQHLVTRESNQLTFIFPWDFVVRTPQEERQVAASGAEADDSDKPNTTRQEKDHSPRFTALPKKAKRHEADSPPEASRTQAANKAFTVNSLLPPQELYEAVSALEPASLVGFASVIAGLARWMQKAQVRLPTVKQVWTTSEVLSPEGADAIRQVLGCEPLKIYASNEFGFMAWQAEKDAPLRIESDRLHVEFLRPGEPTLAATGELSRLVVTDLLNDTMPLIRYDIGDVARPRGPVRATDSLVCATLDGLEGKEADQIHPPDGRSVTTFQILGAIKDTLPHAQYRFVGLSASRYVVQYVPGVGFDPAHLDKTTAKLKEILGEGIELLTQSLDVIRRERSGKLRPVVNLAKVSPGMQRKLAELLGVLHLLEVDEKQVARSLVTSSLARVLPLFKESGALDESLELYADLAISSLQFVQLLAALERELAREIDDEDLLDAELITVGDLVEFVLRLGKTTHEG